MLPCCRLTFFMLRMFFRATASMDSEISSPNKSSPSFFLLISTISLPGPVPASSNFPSLNRVPMKSAISSNDLLIPFTLVRLSYNRAATAGILIYHFSPRVFTGSLIFFVLAYPGLYQMRQAIAFSGCPRPVHTVHYSQRILSHYNLLLRYYHT